MTGTLQPVRISVAYGKPGGRGMAGMTYTFAAWWRKEPTETPWAAPDAFGGGESAEDARARAEAAARRFRDGRGPVIEIHSRWARAERTRRKEEREAASLQRARERADRNLEQDVARVRAFIVQMGGAPEYYLFTAPSGIGIPGVYVINRSDGRTVWAHHLLGSTSVDIELDQQELERIGRVWSDRCRCYVFAVPPDLRKPPEQAPPRVQRVDIAGTVALALLGLGSTATAADVRRAYRRAVASEKCHPDQSGGDATRFLELTRAREKALAAVEGRA